MAKQPTLFAHRGARRVAPENTLPAFAAALEMGVDGIELDVHVTLDGELVVIHDFDVGITTDGQGLVTQMTAAEIARLDAGSSFDLAFAGTHVPTLAEAFDLIGGRCQVNIEIKSMDIYARDATDGVAAFIQARDLHEQVIVSSFNPITLIKLRHLDPRIRLGFLFSADLPDFLREAWAGAVIQPEAWHPHFSAVDAELVDWVHSHRAAINVWTVNDISEARRLVDLGIDMIMTDTPDLLRQGLTLAHA